MNGMNHERFEELKDAYVLDALSEEEHREFDEYLATHPERRAQIDELMRLAGQGFMLAGIGAVDRLGDQYPTPQRLERVFVNSTPCACVS